jgi:hypothetical protein
VERLSELQQALIADDVWLPGRRQEFSRLTAGACLQVSHGDPEVLRNGLTRPLDGSPNRWDCRVGDVVELRFATKSDVTVLDMVFDSDFSHPNALSHHSAPADGPPSALPPRLVRAFHVDAFDGAEWRRLVTERDNCRRFVRMPLQTHACGLRIGIDATWGAVETGIYAVHAYQSAYK